MKMYSLTLPSPQGEGVSALQIKICQSVVEKW
jgi:hypothetical protein